MCCWCQYERLRFFGIEFYLCLHIECHFESVHADAMVHTVHREFILFMEQLSTAHSFILACQYEKCNRYPIQNDLFTQAVIGIWLTEKALLFACRKMLEKKIFENVCVYMFHLSFALFAINQNSTSVAIVAPIHFSMPSLHTCTEIGNCCAQRIHTGDNRIGKNSETTCWYST